MNNADMEKLGVLRALLYAGYEDWDFDGRVFSAFPINPVEGLFVTEFWTDGEWVLCRDIWEEGYTVTGVCQLCLL